MKHTVHVNSEETRRRAIALIKERPALPFDVTISDHKRDRSASQNALLWLWYTVIANEMGETKEEVHFQCKRRFLVPIFTRDDPNGYGQMVTAIRNVHKSGMKDAAKAMADQIVKLTSTTNCNVQQFTEMLNDIEKYYITLGIVLPHPEDRYYEAMGIK